jgi:diaminohydroxyphosphoribosylaminopyrimidine deaminase/5-amino-6-(5-phosphoribosylamino)uracil reductase
MGNQNPEDRFMRAAIVEARRGVGRTGANPAVGAVIVRNGRILARGYHRKEGAAHAEIEAMRALRSQALARGATLYVTLEPCSTQGRTPPCTASILQAGFAQVVFGTSDPNPKNAGRAASLLEAAGIRVRSGLLASECAAINRAWNCWIATGLPYVIAKAGMTLDGRISAWPGTRWITSPASRADAMQLRASCEAVLVGAGTVRADNPRLTVRGLGKVRQPVPVVWSRSGRLPLPNDAHVLRSGRARIFRGVSLRSCLRALARQGIQSVLVEGGGRTLGEAFDRGLVRHAVFYIAPVLTGGPVPAVGGKGCGVPADGWRLEAPDYRILGGDVRVSGDVVPAVSG